MATQGPLEFHKLKLDFLQSVGRRDYLPEVFNFVLEHRGKSYKLKNPAGAILKIGGVDDTIYKCSDVDEWGKFYLPKEVSMQVVGVVEGKSCPCDYLVLMTCEDEKFYAYDGEELHVVASSLKKLYGKGIKYPGKKSYYNGEAFKDMTEQNWDEVRKGAVGQELNEAHLELVKKKSSKFLENLAK